MVSSRIAALLSVFVTVAHGAWVDPCDGVAQGACVAAYCEWDAVPATALCKVKSTIAAGDQAAYCLAGGLNGGSPDAASCDDGVADVCEWCTVATVGICSTKTMCDSLTTAAPNSHASMRFGSVGFGLIATVLVAVFAKLR